MNNVITAVASFAAFSTALTLAPGPDILLVMRNLIGRGRRSGMSTALGAATGSLAWGVGAAVGVATLLAHSATAYHALKLLGAAYLVFLGIQALWQRRGRKDEGAHSEGADQSAAAPEGAIAGASGSRPRLVSSFRAGLTSDLLNPKVGLFFLAVLPQFIPAGYSTMNFTLLLAVVDFVVSVLWLVLLVAGAHQAVRLLRPRMLRLFERVSGVFLVGLGVTVAVESARS